MKYLKIILCILISNQLFSQQTYFSFDRKLEREVIVNIGADFARAPIFINRSYIYEDTLYLNLGSFQRDSINELKVLLVSLSNGAHIFQSIELHDTLVADRRYLPSAIRLENNFLYIQEGENVLQVKRRDNKVTAVHSFPKGYSLFGVRKELLLFGDSYYNPLGTEAKIYTLNLINGDRSSASVPLSTPELTFYGWSRLFDFDENYIYVSQIAEKKIHVFDYSLKEVKQVLFDTDYWYSELEATKSNKHLSKLKKNDPFEYGVNLGRDYCSRIGNIKSLSNGQLLVAISHPSRLYENVKIDIGNQWTSESSSIRFDTDYFSKNPFSFDNYRPWESYVNGIFNETKLASIQVSSGKSRFENEVENNSEISDDDYFISVYIFN